MFPSFNIIFICTLLSITIIEVNSDITVNDPNVKIIGGTKVAPGEIPYQAVIFVKLNNDTFAVLSSAVIVNSKYVLTAAHSLLDDNFKFFTDDVLYVVAGIVNISLIIEQDSKLLNVERKIIHPDFESDTNILLFKNDLALLKINDTFNTSQLIDFANFATYPTSIDQRCIIAGWGSLRPGDVGSMDLMKVTVMTINRTDCQIVYKNTSNIVSDLDKRLCAKNDDPSKGTCTGDNGGPLVCGNIVVGIASFVYGCEFINTPQMLPSIYFETLQYNDWIKRESSASTIRNSLVLFTFLFGIIKLCIKFTP